jgi:hypothetical protein
MLQPSFAAAVALVCLALNNPPTTDSMVLNGTAPARARGTFEVKLAPLSTTFGDDKRLGRLSIDKTFQGDLAGTGKGEMLTAATEVQSSAVYVAIERVSGTLHGKRGTFVAHHVGIMNRGSQQLAISVVPDSGTEELTGISGTMTISIADGKHVYDFDYTLPVTP